jgi:hypothetical protein
MQTRTSNIRLCRFPQSCAIDFHSPAMIFTRLQTQSETHKRKTNKHTYTLKHINKQTYEYTDAHIRSIHTRTYFPHQIYVNRQSRAANGSTKMHTSVNVSKHKHIFYIDSKTHCFCVSIKVLARIMAQSHRSI